MGYNSIIVKTKPLENKIIPVLTPQMLAQTDDGYVIEKSSDDFCGMSQVEIQDVALASNLEYTITPADLTNYNDGTYTLNFKFAGNRSSENIPFENFSDDVRELYTDSNGNSTVFGAKNLTINVPLVEYHEFTVDSKTLGKTFTPADVPPSLDGTGGNAGKLGFKKVKVKANLKSTITADTIVANARAGGGKIYSAGSTDAESGNDIDGLGIGYSAVEIPPITTAINCQSPLKGYNYALAALYYHLDDFDSLEFDCTASNKSLAFAIKDLNLDCGYLIPTIDESTTSLSTNLIDLYNIGLKVDLDSNSGQPYRTLSGGNSVCEQSELAGYIQATKPILVDSLILPFPPIIGLSLDYTSFLATCSSNTVNKEALLTYLNPLIPTSTNTGALVSELSIHLPKIHSTFDTISLSNITQSIDYVVNRFSDAAFIDKSNSSDSYFGSQPTNPLENYTFHFPGLDAIHNCFICIDNTLGINANNISVYSAGSRLMIPPAFENIIKQIYIIADVAQTYNSERPTDTMFCSISAEGVNLQKIHVFHGIYSVDNKIVWTEVAEHTASPASADTAYKISNMGDKSLVLALYKNNTEQQQFYYITKSTTGLPLSKED